MCYKILSSLADIYPGDLRNYRLIRFLYLLFFVSIFLFGSKINILFGPKVLAKIIITIILLYIPINVKIFLNEKPDLFKIKLLCYGHVIISIGLFMFLILYWPVPMKKIGGSIITFFSLPLSRDCKIGVRWWK